LRYHAAYQEVVDAMRTQLIAVGVVAAVVTAITAEAAHQLVVPRNSVGSAQIRNGAILPADLNRQTVNWLNAGAPTPRGRGVTVSSGEHGDRMRVHAATIAEGDVLGQVEYLGGLTCPNLRSLAQRAGNSACKGNPPISGGFLYWAHLGSNQTVVYDSV
jgi:hypothetical protein